ncbi:MAG: glycosyltransferase family 4 protein [Acetivibrio ethanolgignens]
MIYINMLSKAHTVKGQGVLSAHDEQVRLVKTRLSDTCFVTEDDRVMGEVNHYHTINLRYFFHALWAKLRGRVRVGYVHFLPETLENSIHLPNWMRRIFYWYVIRFYKEMDELVVVNPYFINELEKYGIPKDKVTYIPNFVSALEFYPAKEKKKNDRFTVLCAGQLQKRKGVLEVIRLAEELPQVRFLWAGNFAFGKISEGYEEIRKAVENPPENLEFLGLVDRKAMKRLYQEVDLFFLPSYEELFPMTILEAWSCHTPVLVRKLPIYQNVLFDFVEYGENLEDFRDKIQRWEKKPPAMELLREAAKRGSAYYSEERIAGLWKEFYIVAKEHHYVYNNSQYKKLMGDRVNGIHY